MFVKLYRYKIKKNALHKWKKIMKVAGGIYKKHGDKSKWVVLIKKEKNYISMIDMSFYKTKKEFLGVQKRVDKDKTIYPSYNEFKNILHNKSKRFVEEDFETV